MAGSRLAVLAQFLIALGLQIPAASFGMLFGATPNLLLAWVLCLVWSGRTVPAVPAAFVGGLIYDGVTGGSYGWSSLLMTAVAYGAGWVRRPALSGRMAVGLAAGAVCGAFLAFSPGRGFAWNGATVAKWAVLSAVYNTCAAVCLDALFFRPTWKKRSFSGI